MGLVMVGTRSSSAIGDLLTVSTSQYVNTIVYTFAIHFTVERYLFFVSFSMLEKLNMKRYSVD